MPVPVYYHETDLYPYQPISPIYMIIYVLLSYGFFTQLNRIIVSKHLKSDWLKYNTLLSFIHSSISSVLVIISVIRTPEMFEDPLSHSNHFNYFVVSFTTGYFIYDLMDCLQNTKSNISPIICHHIVCLAFLFHVLYYTRNIGYTIYGLSIEINSIFLHARRLLRWYRPIHNHRVLQILVDIANYITLIVLRFGITYIILRAAFIYRNRFHPIVHTFTVTCVLAIGVLNIVLLYRLVKNQIKPKAKVKQENTENHVLLPSSLNKRKQTM